MAWCLWFALEYDTPTRCTHAPERRVQQHTDRGQLRAAATRRPHAAAEIEARERLVRLERNVLLLLPKRTGASSSSGSGSGSRPSTRGIAIIPIATTDIAASSADSGSTHRGRAAAGIQSKRAQADGARRGQREVVRGAVKLLRRPRQHDVQRLRQMGAVGVHSEMESRVIGAQIIRR
jgi:hypothetical protein